MKKQMTLFDLSRPKKKSEKPEYSSIARVVSQKRLDGLKIELEKYREWHKEKMAENIAKTTAELIEKLKKKEEDAY